MTMQQELNSKEDLRPGFREWCICEFMGHLRIIGLVSEQDLFGTKLARVDIPATDRSVAHTEYFGGNSIYRLSPIGEAEARELLTMAEAIRPVTPWELNRLNAASFEPRNNLSTSPRPDDFDLDEEEEPDSDEDESEDGDDQDGDQSYDFETDHWADEMEADDVDA